MTGCSFLKTDCAETRIVKVSGKGGRRIVQGLSYNRIFAPLVLALLGAAISSYHLGYKALGASEAYSALAAAQPTVRGVAQTAMTFDPGKPVLYHLLLHWFCVWFGASELALRSFSIVFAPASIVMVFGYGTELFGSEVGWAAAAMWMVNPLSVLFARWARMYSMFVAFTLAHLLAMTKLRRRMTKIGTLTAGVLGAAMLYTHLGGLLIIGADLVVVVREFRRERRSAGLPAIAIALLLFVPFMPAAVWQGRALLFGHWVDWIGVAHCTGVTRAVAVGIAGISCLWLALGGRHLGPRSESAVCCSVYVLIPLIGLLTGSIVIRPMFTVRYAAPSFAVAGVLVAWALDCKGFRALKDGTTAITALLIFLLPLTYSVLDQPWRGIAHRVAETADKQETIFFEAGFFSADGAIGPEDGGFPQGFFLVPFKYYFKGPNPNAAVPGNDPLRARQLIESAIRKAGGAWLISGKIRPEALAELPKGSSFHIDYDRNFSQVLVFHVRLTTA